MVADIQKMVVVPVDGSENVSKTLNYINLFFGPEHALIITLFYVQPRLPAILVEESRKSGETIKQLENLEKRNTEIAERLLAAGIKNVQITSKVADGSRSAAADILEEAQRVDAGPIFLGLHGYSSVKEYTMGSVTRKVLNHAADMAVCIVP